MRKVNLSPFILDLGDILETRPQLCANVREIAARAGFRRPESILKRVPAGKKLVPIMCLVSEVRDGQ